MLQLLFSSICDWNAFECLIIHLVCLYHTVCCTSMVFLIFLPSCVCFFLLLLSIFESNPNQSYNLSNVLNACFFSSSFVRFEMKCLCGWRINKLWATQQFKIHEHAAANIEKPGFLKRKPSTNGWNKDELNEK